jgi:hypothetical protein
MYYRFQKKTRTKKVRLFIIYIHKFILIKIGETLFYFY